MGIYCIPDCYESYKHTVGSKCRVFNVKCGLVTTGLQGVIKTDSYICSLSVYIQGNYWRQVLCVTHKMLKRTENQVRMD